MQLMLYVRNRRKCGSVKRFVCERSLIFLHAQVKAHCLSAGGLNGESGRDGSSGHSGSSGSSGHCGELQWFT